MYGALKRRVRYVQYFLLKLTAARCNIGKNRVNGDERQDVDEATIRLSLFIGCDYG